MFCVDVTDQTVLNLKRDEVGTLRNRLQIGLDKLMTTAHEVAKLQEELTAMEPKLVATQKEVEEMIVTLEADKKTAAETKVWGKLHLFLFMLFCCCCQCAADTVCPSAFCCVVYVAVG